MNNLHESKLRLYNFKSGKTHAENKDVKIKRLFDSWFDSLEETYDFVKNVLNKTGRILHGDDISPEKYTVRFTPKIECSIIPHGGFGLLHSIGYTKDWTEHIDNDILVYLKPFDLDIILFCNSCLQESSNNDKREKLKCDELLSVLKILINSVSKDMGSELDTTIINSYSKNNIYVKGDPVSVDISVINTFQGENIKNYTRQINLEKAIRAYLDFGTENKIKSTRFMRVKVRAALAIFCLNNENFTKESVIQYLEENKNTILAIDDQLDIEGIDIKTEYIKSIENIVMNEFDKERNVKLTMTYIMSKNLQELVKVVKILEPSSWNEILPSFTDLNDIMFIYEALLKTSILQQRRDILGDLGYILTIFETVHNRLPNRDELMTIHKNIKKQKIEDLPKIKEVYFVCHGIIVLPPTDYPATIDIRNNLTLSIFGQPGFRCFARASNLFDGTSFKDRVLEQNKSTKYRHKIGFHIRYSIYGSEHINRNEIFEFHTSNGDIVKEPYQIYMLTRLLLDVDEDVYEDYIFVYSAINIYTKKFHLADILKNIEKTVFTDVVQLHSVSCLRYENEETQEFYNEQTKQYRTFAGASNTNASTWFAISLGFTVTAICAVLGPM